MSTYQARKNQAQRNSFSSLKLLTTSALTAAGLMMASQAHAQNVDPGALPLDPTVTQGGATFDYSEPNTLTIGQLTPLTTAEYAGGFNIGSAASVFVDQNTGDIFVHIDKSPNTSFIEGVFAGSGSNFVLNRNGVLITGSARIDMHSFAASTAESVDIAFGGEQIKFNNLSDAKIVIEEGAMINVGQAGLAAFVAPTVQNAGIINAKMGTVAFAAGETVTLDMYGDGLFEVAVDGELADAYLENTGEINAQGGVVQVTASAAKEAVDNIINVDGIVTVASATQVGGKIILSGGNKGVVSVSGDLDASGATDGGDVSVTGENVDIAESSDISVRAAGEDGDGGTAYIYGDDYAIFRGRILGSGGSVSGNGANAEISGGESVGYYGFADLSATNGETGTLLIDPRHLNIGDGATSGILADLLTGGTIETVNINSRALADTLASANVSLWATETLNTTSDVDLSVGTEQVGTTRRGPFVCRLFGCPVFGDSITDNNLSLSAPTVNIDHDITLGTGTLDIVDISSSDSLFGLGLLRPPFDIAVETLNLDGKIYTRSDLSDPAFTELASDAQINTDADTINVISNAASIQQAVQFAGASDADTETITVGDGTFNEAVVVDRAVTLIGDGPTNTTTIEVAENTAGFTVTSSDVTIDGFRFERDGNAKNTVGIRLDGRTTANGTISNITIGDTDADADEIGNVFVDELAIGVEARGDVDTVTISDNTFGEGTGDDRITKGIVTRVERNGSTVIDGSGTELGQNDIAPHNDWLITDNDFSIKNGAKSAALDLEGVSGTTEDSFEVSGNIMNGSAKVAIHIPAVGGNGSGAPYPLTTNLLIDDNTITGFGTAIRVGANFDSVSPGNDRFRMSSVNITRNVINDTGTGIDVSGVTFATMSDVTIDGNTINGARNTGIRLNVAGRLNDVDPDWTGFVISGNDVNLGDTGTGLSITYSLDTEIEIGEGNSFDGGENGIVINGQNGRTLTLVGNTLNDTEFTNQSGDYIRLEDTAAFAPGNFTTIDATNVTFDGIKGADVTGAQGIAIEEKIVHQMDDAGLGFVEIQDGSLFVTEGGEGIQHAVDISSNGDDIFVGAGLFEESVNVYRRVSLFGNNAGTDGFFTTRKDETVVTGSSPAFTVTTDNVTIDGFTLDGGVGGSLTYGVLLNDVKGVEVSNNIIKNSSIAGIGGVVDHDNAVQVDLLVEGNRIDDSNTGDGINIMGDGAGAPANPGALVGVRIDIDNNLIGFDGDDAGGANNGVGGSAIVLSKIGDPNDEADAFRGRDEITATEFNITGNAARGQIDGLRFDGIVDEATIDIDGGSFVGLGGTGIAFSDKLSDSDVTIQNTSLISGTSGAVSFANVDDAKVDIKSNTSIFSTSNAVSFNDGLEAADIDLTSNTIRTGERGVRFAGDIDGETTIDASGNTIGTNAGRVKHGFDIGSVKDATVNISGGSIDSSDDAIRVSGTTSDSTFTFTNLDVEAGDEAIDFNTNINGSVTVDGGTLIGEGNGLETNRISGSGSVTVKNGATIEGNGSNRGNGINILDSINGTVSVISSTIKGGVSGIGRGGSLAANVDGGTVSVTGSTITGVNGDGIELGAVTDSANVNISNNIEINGAANGVDIEGDVTESTVTIGTNTIRADNGIGIAFQGDIKDTQNVSITGNTIGSDVNRVITGILLNRIEDAKVVISGGSIDAGGGSGPGNAVDGDGIHLANGTQGGADVDITGVTITSSNAEAVDVQDTIRVMSTFDINGGSYTGADDGVELTRIQGAATITGATIEGQGETKSGIHLRGGIKGDLKISNSTITGGDDGIGADNSNFNTVDGGLFEVTGSTVTGRNSDGIELAEVKNAGTVNINNNVRISGGDDGILLLDGVSGGSTVTISGNTDIAATNGNGIKIDGDTTSISGGSTVAISGNTIDAGNDGIDIESDITGTNTALNILNNGITADDDGIDVDNVNSNAVVNIGGPNENDGNTIVAVSDGIEFDSGIDSTVLIQANRISTTNNDGIAIFNDDANTPLSVSSAANVQILDNKIGSEGNDRIGQDGIDFDDFIGGGSTVTISENTIGRNTRYVGDNGIEFDGVSGATVNITNNTDIRARDNGIEFGNEIEDGTVNITENNHGIHAGQHGITFNDEVTTGGVVNIHDNIISSNEDPFDGIAGNGIHFNDEVNSNAQINIGNGDGSNEDVNGSNVIRGFDGIHFADDVFGTAQVKIDGNRLGFRADSFEGPYDNARLSGDGIEFHNIFGDARVTIIDNHIRAGVDGIHFDGTVNGNANITIGGLPGNKNTINANENGIEFDESISGNAIVEISHNAVTSLFDGLRFEGGISNVAAQGVRQDELLIDNNDIEVTFGNGIQFLGTISDNRQDTTITNNDIFVGSFGENGISIAGNIDDASVRINDNKRIQGDNDGVNVSGDLVRGARLRINNNALIASRDEDGIDFDGNITGNSFVSINDNDDIQGDTTGISASDNSGIEFANINDGRVEIKDNNENGIIAEDDGIRFNGDVTNGSRVDILDNLIVANTDNGISGAGILFNGEVTDSDITIGDGDLEANPSNIISVGSTRFGNVGGLDGIRFNDTISGDSNVNIEGNRIGFTEGKVGLEITRITDDGIQFDTISGNAEINVIENDIQASGDGIFFSGSTSNVAFGGTGEPTDAINIAQNTISGTRHGVNFIGQASGADHIITIEDNTIDGDNGNGIQHTGGILGAALNIVGNTSITGDNNAILISGFLGDSQEQAARINIDANELIQGGVEDGIQIVDNGVEGADISITGNTVQFGQNGVNISALAAELLIDGNTITDAQENGILLNALGGFESPVEETAETGFGQIALVQRVAILREPGEFNSSVTGNTIANNGETGLNATGAGHNTITVSDNTFTDNPTGARFESGIIDISGLPNTFEISDEFEGPVVGLQFDIANIEDPTTLSLVGDTIGTTIFDGFLDRPVGDAFFVRIENDTLVTPGGVPIEIDGVDANFDGIIPNTFPGTILPLDTLLSLEDRIFDATDILEPGIRGNLFVGFPPSLNFEDFLQGRALTEFGTSGVSLRVAGLPSTGPLTPAAIEPAAGGEEAQDPATTAAEFASLEPAAGGEEGGVECASQLGTALGTGDTVDYSFGDNFEESLASAAACGGGI